MSCCGEQVKKHLEVYKEKYCISTNVVWCQKASAFSLHSDREAEPQEMSWLLQSAEETSENDQKCESERREERVGETEPKEEKIW